MSFICGDILYFVTDKVTRSRPKPKYHVCVCTASGTYLFINSDPFQGAFEINQADFPQLPNSNSYVSCNAPVKYSASALAGYSITKKGRLSDECLKRLMDHVQQSLVMPEEDIETIVNAIYSHLSK